jgi:hypothetical protein
MKDLGFMRSTVNHFIFFRQSDEEHTIVTVATDDMAVISKHMDDTIKFKSEIK